MLNKVCNVIFIMSLILMLITCGISFFIGGINSISCKITVICVITSIIFGVIIPELFD